MLSASSWPTVNRSMARAVSPTPDDAHGCGGDPAGVARHGVSTSGISMAEHRSRCSRSSLEELWGLQMSAVLTRRRSASLRTQPGTEFSPLRYPAYLIYRCIYIFLCRLRLPLWASETTVGLRHSRAPSRSWPGRPIILSILLPAMLGRHQVADTWCPKIQSERCFLTRARRQNEGVGLT
jgi:hypothetical protein